MNRRSVVKGALTLACVPSLLDTYVTRLASLWENLGKPFSDTELAVVRRLLEQGLNHGYASSPHARIVIEYESKPPPEVGIDYRVKVADETIGERYGNWMAHRARPIFGAAPDAKVMNLAAMFSDPSTAPVLDVGAGTGRNSVPLAGRGHPAHAIELVPSFAEELRKSAASAGVSLKITEGDALAPECVLETGLYKLVILTEVIATHFREIEEVRQMMTKLADAIAPGGLLLFDAFLPVDGYKPDPAIRQISHVAWSCVFTRADLQFIHEELPFDKVSDESEHDYEQQHLPPAAWPPTTWFPDWSQGLNLFDVRPGKAPVELRWLVYRRR